MKKIVALTIQSVNVSGVGVTVATMVSRDKQDIPGYYLAEFWVDAPRAARRMRRFLRLQSEFLRRAVESEPTP